jgi:hypothetical protein
MTLDFKTPELSQKPVVDRAVEAADVQVCDQTFGNLFSWAACYDAQIALWGENFVSRWGNRYAVPVGPQRKEILEYLMAEGITRFLGVDDRYKGWLEQTFPGRFTFKEKRNSADYIYDRQSLEMLVGKKLAAKRNHINYFEQHHQWELRSITAENMAEIMAFNDRWCQENNCLSDSSLERESCAVRRGLKYYDALGYTGFALYADGAVCAFSYGERIGKAGFCVHVEKADAALRGAYPMINRELVRRLPAEICWINREDDAGDEGLRRAKTSYQPSVLLMKYEAEIIE